MKIPFNPVSIISAKVWRKKTRQIARGKFSTFLQEGKTVADTGNTKEQIAEDTTLALQQARVQHLLRVHELKGRVTHREHAPSMKYLHTENIARDYFLSSIGTKQQRNLEIVINDEQQPHERNSFQPKDK